MTHAESDEGGLVYGFADILEEGGSHGYRGDRMRDNSSLQDVTSTRPVARPARHQARARGVAVSALAILWPPALTAQIGDRTPAAPDTTPATTHPVTVAEAFTGFDDFITATLAEWQVPGLAVGVIRDGEVILARGFGYRDRETRLPVSEHTTMAIGSNSKSFTVTLLAILADEGRLDWDRPVREYVPDFQLYDDFATAEMTPRDLVTHQSGLPRHDNMWYGRSRTRAEIFEKLRYLEPNASFRSRYQYQNLMFMAAGHLAERIAGRDWHGLIDERIFTPLGMVRSTTSIGETPGSGDAALPYVLHDGVLERVPFRNMDPMGPAGSINSNVMEMLVYVQTHLDGGVFAGRRIISEENSARMQQPQFAIPGESEFAELGQVSYGLGLRVGSYRGHKMVDHGGVVDGFISSMSWLPRERIGVIVLSNRSGDMNPVPEIVAYNIYDRLLGLPEINWNARNLRLRAEQDARAAESQRDLEARRVKGTRPSHDLSAYSGRYDHPAYGVMKVHARAGRLEIVYDGCRLELEHYHYDTFTINSRPSTVPVTGLVTFSANESGEVASVAIPFEPNGADIVFDRIRPPS